MQSANGFEYVQKISDQVYHYDISEARGQLDLAWTVLESLVRVTLVATDIDVYVSRHCGDEAAS